GHLHAGLVGIDLAAVRAAADGHQHTVIVAGFGRVLALETGLERFLVRLHTRDSGAGPDIAAALFHALVERLDQVAVGRRNQAVGHFDDVDLGTVGGVHI